MTSDGAKDVVIEVKKLLFELSEKTSSSFLEAASYSALGDINDALIGFVMGAILLLVCYNYITHPKREEERTKDRREKSFEEFPRLGMIFSYGGIILGFFMFGMNLSTLMQPVNWAGVFKPDVYIAHTVLKKIEKVK